MESNPYVPWTGGNHQVSRVGWDEESGGDEGGHLHQGPHLILRQGVARMCGGVHGDRWCDVGLP